MGTKSSLRVAMLTGLAALAQACALSAGNHPTLEVDEAGVGFTSVERLNTMAPAKGLPQPSPYRSVCRPNVNRWRGLVLRTN